MSRGWTGPFWFPGVALPAGVPAALGAGLVLHLAYEVVGDDVSAGLDLDPLAGPVPTGLPEGMTAFRERRFAADPRAVDAVRDWLTGLGLPPAVVPFGGARPRRL